MIPAVRDSVQNMLPPVQHVTPANMSLLFNRLCQAIDEPREQQNKKNTVEALINGYSNDCMTLYKHSLKQWRHTMSNTSDALCFTMKTTSPMVVGKGDQNVHEFGITLLHPWATPVIPGSAIKGVLSTFAHEQGDETWNKSCLSLFAGKHALIMFGGTDKQTQSHAGCLDFLDAWWIPGDNDNKPFIKDIITVHNRSYYQENTVAFPDGTDDPLPNEFVVVKPGTEFLFVIRGALAWCELARNMMKDAVQECGFGAKTRVGYGSLQYQRSPEEVAEDFPEMSDEELKTFFTEHGGRPKLTTAFHREAKRRPYSDLLDKLFRRFRPIHAFLNVLESRKVNNWRDIRNVHNNYKMTLQDIDILATDPDVQAIFSLCHPHTPDNLPPENWLWQFAPSAEDLIAGKDADQIESFLNAYESSANPSLVAFEEAIENNSDLDEDDKELLLDTLKTLLKNKAL